MPLAAGGMARIYVGRTTGIGSFERHVVLKVILPERANDQVAVHMFLDEARLAAALNHQNVAQVFEVGEDQGIHYLAMEYVHGQDLRALLAKAGSEGKRVPLELALTVVAGAAAGLNHAHDRRGPDGTPLGIVHRDVSPSNIMVGYDGSVKLLDFGIAKATARSVETQNGIIKGKFAYMAPEQCRGRDVDRRSDVFSLGIILYEISTQHRCFRADSDFDTMHRIVTGDVVRPSRLVPGYPAPLEAIVMKALAVDAAQRYQSAGDLLEALENFTVESRMSTSQMALGRFMREMFGDVGEPWLTNQRAQTNGAEPPRESTISNTNGTGDDPRATVPVMLVATELVSPRPSAVTEANQPPRTMLDLPRPAGADPTGDDADDSDDDVAGDAWNAKSYPQGQPSYASSETLHPDSLSGAQLQQLAVPRAQAAANDASGSRAMPSPSSPPAIAIPRALTGPHGALATPPGPLPLPHAGAHGAMAAGTQPMPGSAAFQTPGSASGPAIPLPNPTHFGYASGAAAGQPSGANDLSYPRYEASGESEVPPDLDVRPNRRLVYIILGVCGVALIALIALLAGGGSKPAAPAPPVDLAVAPGSDGSAAASEPSPRGPRPTVPPPMPSYPQKGSDAVVLPPVPAKGSDTSADDLIAVHVETTPVPGAEIDLDGKPLGRSPLDIKLKRTSANGQLVVKMIGYVDATAKVDLSGDFSKVIALKKDEPDAPVVPPHHDPVVVPVHHDPTPHTPAHKDPVPPGHKDPVPTGHKDPTPKKPDCQKPGPNLDPFKPVCKT